MSIEKMREEFEAWESEADDGPQTDPMWLMFDSTLNQFALIEVQSRWSAWQASREALVIELPAIIDKEWANTHAERSAMREAIGWCKKRIEAAGLKVKP